MSSHHKNTSSESSESHSDREVNKEEENLEQSKIGDRLTKEGTKDDPGESKPLASPTQVGTSTSKCDPLKEPIAGPSGLQKPRLVSSDQDSKVASLTDPHKEQEAKDIYENIGAEMLEEECPSTLSTPPFIQSSTGVTPSSMLQDVTSSSMSKEKSPVAGPSRIKGEIDISQLPINVAYSPLMSKSSRSSSSSSRRFVYASDSAHTLSDVSDISLEITDSSAPKSLDKDQSPGCTSAVEGQSSESSDSNISELQDDDLVPPPRHGPNVGKKSKMAESKSNPSSQSSSGSYEPKSSSSGESHRKKSPDITSSRVVQEVSKSQIGRKSWQKSGVLRSMQLPAMSSKDSVIAEEEDRTSHLRGQDELIETKDPTPEKMETALDKGSEGAAENTQRSELMPVVESSHLVYGSEVGILQEHKQSSKVPELERSVRKSKRVPKLSSSTSSDKEKRSSPPKAASSRPKKRARYDKMTGKTRTRHDSGGTVSKSVGLGKQQQSESTSTPDPGDCTPDSSDYTPSDSESETAI